MTDIPTLANKHAHWSSLQEAGTLFGMRLLLLFYRYFGRRAFSVILGPIVLYFIVLRPHSRESSRNYLLTHSKYFPNAWNQPITLKYIYKHFKCFAETILDKVLAWNNNISKEELEIPNSLSAKTLINSDKGQLLIGAHFGNLEFCRSFIQSEHNKTINILVYDRHSTNFISMMQQINPDSRLNIFQVDEFDISTVLKLREKVDQGEWVFIAADRIPVTGLNPTAKVSFLGRDALFPIGPYYLAHALGCPVSLIFAYRYTDDNTSKIMLDIVPFSDKISLTRESRNSDLAKYAKKFSIELERQCQRAPLQWFNFYDFWATQNTKPNNPSS